MTRYHLFCLGAIVFTAVLAVTVSTAYWPTLLLVLSAAAIGELLAETLFNDESLARRRPQRLGFACAVILVPAIVFNIWLLSVLSSAGLLAVLFGSICRDFTLLQPPHAE